MIFEILVFCIISIPFITQNLQNSKKIYCITIAVILIFVSGFRSYNIGTDTPAYVQVFLNSDKISLNFLKDILTKREPLFLLYLALVRTISDNYSLFLLPIAIFYISTASSFIYKYSKTPLISYIILLSMGYFSFSMAGLRQTIGYAILIIATDKLIDRKYLISVLLIFIASLFHITSLVYFVVFIVILIPLNKWYLIIVLGFSLFSYFYGSSVLLRIVEIVWADTRGYKEIEFGGISTLLLLLVVATATLFFYPELLWSQSNKNNISVLSKNKYFFVDQLFTKLLLLSIPIQLMAIYQANIFRVATMFHFFITCLIPSVIIRQRESKIIFMSQIVVVFFLILQLFMFTRNSGNILPFTFFWEI